MATQRSTFARRRSPTQHFPAISADSRENPKLHVIYCRMSKDGSAMGVHLVGVAWVMLGMHASDARRHHKCIRSFLGTSIGVMLLVIVCWQMARNVRLDYCWSKRVKAAAENAARPSTEPRTAMRTSLSGKQFGRSIEETIWLTICAVLRRADCKRAQEQTCTCQLRHNIALALCGIPPLALL